LEPFTRLQLRLKPGRGELDFLESCQVRDGHAGLRDDLGRIGHAGHAAELCRELCREREPHVELFDLLAGYLAALSGGPARPEDLLAFELLALRHVGVEPRFGDCALCGAALPAGPALCDPAHGGVICGACVGQAPRDAFHAAPQTLAAARLLQQEGPFAGVSIEATRGRAQVRELVRRFTHHQLGRRPRSGDFLGHLWSEG